jgi:hypothetical protein
MTLVCPKTFMSKNVYGRVDPKKMAQDYGKGVAFRKLDGSKKDVTKEHVTVMSYGCSIMPDKII